MDDDDDNRRFFFLALILTGSSTETHQNGANAANASGQETLERRL